MNKKFIIAIASVMTIIGIGAVYLNIGYTFVWWIGAILILMGLFVIGGQMLPNEK